MICIYVFKNLEADLDFIQTFSSSLYTVIKGLIIDTLLVSIKLINYADITL